MSGEIKPLLLHRGCTGGIGVGFSVALAHIVDDACGFSAVAGIFAVIVIIIADGAHTGKGLVDASVAVFQNKGIYNPAVIKDDDSVFKSTLIVNAEGRKGKLLAFELSFSVEGYIKACSVINCAGSIAAELKIAPFGIFIRLAKAVIHGRAKIFSCALFAFLTAGAKTEQHCNSKNNAKDFCKCFHKSTPFCRIIGLL